MRRSFQFTLSFLLVGIALIAIVFGVIRSNRAVVGKMVTGFGEGGSSHRDYQQAREDLRKWLMTRGYHATDEPTWAAGTAVANEEWFVGVYNGVVLHIRVRQFETSFGVYVQFHKLKWPFENASREEAACEVFASELEKWWKNWKVENESQWSPPN